MNPVNVESHIRQLGESMAANGTNERSLSSVYPNMGLDIRGIYRFVVAVTTKQHIRLSDLRESFPDATAGAILNHGLEEKGTKIEKASIIMKLHEHI